MSVNVILATDLNYGIGKNNGLPWPHSKEDMQWFKDNTTGGVIVMGRKTWESIGSTRLPRRINIVVSSSYVEGAHDTVSGDMKDIIANLKERATGDTVTPDTNIWIIGGANIYEQSIPYADKLYLTKFCNEYDCDTYVDESIVDSFPAVEYNKKVGDIIFEIRSR